MSYDYALFRRPAGGPVASWPAAEPPPFGTLDDVKARLGALFPGLTWTRFESSWLGRWEDGARYAEFQVSPGPDGEVRTLTMRRTDRSHVEQACQELGIVALDLQEIELYAPESRRWADAR